MSTKAEIQQSWRLKTETITVGSVSVTMREFTGAARDAYDLSMVKIEDDKRVPDMTNMRVKLVAACAIDEQTGEPMFTEAELAGAPATFIEPLYELAQRLNGLAPGAVEAAEKNSEPAPSGPSSSD